LCAITAGEAMQQNKRTAAARVILGTSQRIYFWPSIGLRWSKRKGSGDIVPTCQSLRLCSSRRNRHHGNQDSNDWSTFDLLAGREVKGAWVVFHQCIRPLLGDLGPRPIIDIRARERRAFSFPALASGPKNAGLVFIDFGWQVSCLTKFLFDRR